MTGKTHRAGGILCSIIGFAILKEKGLLLPDVNEGPQWLIIYPFCMWGCVASDLDQYWESAPTRGLPDLVINKALHITDPLQRSLDKKMTAKEKSKSFVYHFAKFFNAKHRSWQTHSDLTLFLFLGLLIYMMNNPFNFIPAVDAKILILVLTGICIGIVSHLILDALTIEGIWSSPLMLIRAIIQKKNPKTKFPATIHLVPDTRFFKTGGSWETLVYVIIKVLILISLAFFIYKMFNPSVQTPLQMITNLIIGLIESFKNK